MSAPFPLIWLEVFLGLGVPLVWVLWALWQPRRERRKDARKAADPPP